MIHTRSEDSSDSDSDSDSSFFASFASVNNALTGFIDCIINVELENFVFQILHSEPPTLSNKFKDWASSKWNLLDGFAVVAFFVGVGLRLHPTTRSAGHVVYCLDVMLWIIRLLDIFSVSKHMGPYVVMIGRMVIMKCFNNVVISVNLIEREFSIVNHFNPEN